MFKVSQIHLKKWTAGGIRGIRRIRENEKLQEIRRREARPRPPISKYLKEILIASNNTGIETTLENGNQNQKQ